MLLIIYTMKITINTLNSRRHDLKNGEKVLLEITAKKISGNEASELYKSLIKPDIDTLMKSTSRAKNKRENILNVLNKKIGFLDGVYFNYSDKLSESEEIIEERK